MSSSSSTTIQSQPTSFNQWFVQLLNTYTLQSIVYNTHILPTQCL